MLRKKRTHLTLGFMLVVLIALAGATTVSAHHDQQWCDLSPHWHGATEYIVISGYSDRTYPDWRHIEWGKYYLGIIPTGSEWRLCEAE
mgnify:CR=1 FL=1